MGLGLKSKFILGRTGQGRIGQGSMGQDGTGQDGAGQIGLNPGCLELSKHSPSDNEICYTKIAAATRSVPVRNKCCLERVTGSQ